jgi:hypothetical protein
MGHWQVSPICWAKENVMRLAVVFMSALMFLVSPVVHAAEDSWFTYVSREDRFALNLQGEPTVEEFTFVSEYGSPWPARRHTLDYEGYTHRMTVVDMSTTSLAADNDGASPGLEKRGAMAFAAANLRKTGEVILDTYDQVQVIPGMKLEIVLPDGRLNLVELHIFEHLLYIQESISPPDAIPAYDVQSSLELLNGDLIVPRYENTGFPGPVPIAMLAQPVTGTPAELVGWNTVVNREDRFAVAFPGQPDVEEFTYESAQYSPWSARRYSVEQGGHDYMMTVIDMTTSRLGPGVDAFRNTARPGSERSGALAFAAWNFRKSGEVEVDTYAERQVIPGHRLEIALSDGRRNVAEIYEHHDYLYILEHISPAGANTAFDIHDSLQLLDTDGNVPHYVDEGWTFPDFMTMTGDGTGASGRDLGAIIRGTAAP